jgi:SNF2 family DNA or RNA helicase
LVGNKRTSTLEEFNKVGGILLTTYGTISSQFEYFVPKKNEKKLNIDYMFLDEGHKSKKNS